MLGNYSSCSTKRMWIKRQNIIIIIITIILDFVSIDRARNNCARKYSNRNFARSLLENTMLHGETETFKNIIGKKKRVKDEENKNDSSL